MIRRSDRIVQPLWVNHLSVPYRLAGRFEMNDRRISLLSQKPGTAESPVPSVIEEIVDVNRTLYLGSASGTVKRWGSGVVATILGFGSTALLFLALPLCQIISEAHKATRVSTSCRLFQQDRLHL